MFIFGCTRSSLLCADFSLVEVSGGYPSCGVLSSHCGGFSCCGAQALGHVGSVVMVPRLWDTGSVVVAYGLSCSAACGIFLDEGSNPHLLRWQVDSLSLSH